jgi:Rps23 Pro-64 3,4-dihydroxylase Tpa1-like proline 4-hydroxylase
MDKPLEIESSIPTKSKKPLEIIYLENVARSDTFANVVGDVNMPGWSFGRMTDESEDKNTANLFWQQSMQRSNWCTEVLWYEILVRLEEVAPSTKNYQFKVSSVVCGGKTFGQDGSIHTDKDFEFNEEGDGYMTVCFFPNEEWNAEWGGEFQFFNDTGDVIATYYPKPNTCLVFDSNIPHRGLAPTRHCNRLRKCLTYKTFVHKQWFLENNPDVKMIDGSFVPGLTSTPTRTNFDQNVDNSMPEPKFKEPVPVENKPFIPKKRIKK